MGETVVAAVAATQVRLCGAIVVDKIGETESIRLNIDRYRDLLRAETASIVRLAIQSMLGEFEARLRLASIDVPHKRPSDLAAIIDVNQSADPAID